MKSNIKLLFITKKYFYMMVNFCKRKFCNLFWVFLIAFGICLMSPLKPLSNSVPAIDSSVFITISKGIKGGLVPYRDFFDHKGPLLYFINLLGWTIGKTSGIWFIELFLMNISVLFSFKILRMFMPRKCALVGTFLGLFSIVSFFEQGNLTEEYALPFIFISLYLFTRYFIKNIEFRNESLIIIGMCFGSTLLLRPNMFAVWLIFIPLVLLSYFYKKQIYLIVRFIFYFFVGVLIVTLPFISYLIKNSAFNDFIDQYFLFNSQYISQGTSSFIFLKNFIFTTLKGFSWVSLLFPLYLIKTTKGKIKTFHKACFFSSLASILFICLSRSNYNHYGMLMVPLISIQIGFIVNHLNNLNKSNFKTILLKVLLIVFFSELSIKWFSICLTVINNRSKNEAEEVSKIIKDNVGEKDTFIVLGNSCSLYLYTDARLASKYIYQLPIANVSNYVLEDFKSDLIKNKPKIIVLPLSLYSDISTNGDISEDSYLDFIKEILEEKYNRMAFTKNYFIYIKKDIF